MIFQVIAATGLNNDGLVHSLYIKIQTDEPRQAALLAQQLLKQLNMQVLTYLRVYPVREPPLMGMFERQKIDGMYHILADGKLTFDILGEVQAGTYQGSYPRKGA